MKVIAPAMERQAVTAQIAAVHVMRHGLVMHANSKSVPAMKTAALKELHQAINLVWGDGRSLAIALAMKAGAVKHVNFRYVKGRRIVPPVVKRLGISPTAPALVMPVLWARNVSLPFALMPMIAMVTVWPTKLVKKAVSVSARPDGKDQNVKSNCALLPKIAVEMVMSQALGRIVTANALMDLLVMNVRVSPARIKRIALIMALPLVSVPIVAVAATMVGRVKSVSSCLALRWKIVVPTT